MNIKLVLSLIAIVMGGWFIFDAIYVMSTNFYFGGNEPGPWADVLRAVKIEPFEFAPGFLALGGMWLTSLVTMVSRHVWWRSFYGATALLSIWYLPFGTLLSSIALVLLVAVKVPRKRRRRDIMILGSSMSILATAVLTYIISV